MPLSAAVSEGTSGLSGTCDRLLFREAGIPSLASAPGLPVQRSASGCAYPVSLTHSGVIVGASVSHYLLETSRVVFQVMTSLLPTPSPALKKTGHSPQTLLPTEPVSLPQAQAERSFHVFYELLAGLDPMEREQLCLQGPEAYYYLNQVGPRLSQMAGLDSATVFRTLWGARHCPSTSLLFSAGPSLQTPGQGGYPGLQRAGEGPEGAGVVCRGADRSLGCAGHHLASGQHLLLFFRGGLPYGRDHGAHGKDSDDAGLLCVENHNALSCL